MRPRLAAAALLVLAACGSAEEAGSPTSPGSGTAAPTSAVGTDAPAASTAPTETLSTAVVAGPPALTVLGDDGALRWQAPPTAGFTVAMQVAMGDGLLVASTYCDGPVVVKAWDLTTGDTRWSVALPDSIGGGAALNLGSGVVIVSAAPGVAALDAGSGAVLWQAPGRLAEAVPAGLVVTTPVTDQVNEITALDLASGTERWTAGIASGSYVNGVAADDERAYLTTYNGTASEVVALTLADGSEAWRAPFSPGSDRSSVEALGGLVVGWPTDIMGVATAALDGGSGRELWRAGGFGLPQQAPGTTFALDGNVYVSSYDASGILGALDAGTGVTRWTVPVADLGGSMYSTLSAVDGGFLVGVDQDLVMLDATDGTVRWRTQPGGGFLGAGDGAIAVVPAECPNLGD